MALTFGSKLVRDPRFSPRFAGSRTRLEQKEEDYPPKISTFLEMLVPLGHGPATSRVELPAFTLKTFETEALVLNGGPYAF
jgi:hypothetical protein